MCLIVFDWQPDKSRILTLASNRDEFYQRPALDAHYWEDIPHIFGGRDLKMNGTWLAISKHGRLAAVTNYRSPDAKEYARSRGEIPHYFLSSSDSAVQFCQSLPSSEYAGFNALLFDGEQLVYCTNRSHEYGYQVLKPGNYGLSNHLLNTPWPKVRKTLPTLYEAKQMHDKEQSALKLLEALGNDEQALKKDLPNTGIAEEIELMLSPAFILSPNYGTRTSSVLIIEKDTDETQLRTYFWERLYQAGTRTFEDRSHQIDMRYR